MLSPCCSSTHLSRPTLFCAGQHLCSKVPEHLAWYNARLKKKQPGQGGTRKSGRIHNFTGQGSRSKEERARPPLSQRAFYEMTSLQLCRCSHSLVGGGEGSDRMFLNLRFLVTFCSAVSWFSNQSLVGQSPIWLSVPFPLC